MSDLLQRIAKHITQWGQGEKDDVVSDVAVLVLEGRIDGSTDEGLKAGIARYIAGIKRGYHSGGTLSLNQPITDSGLTLEQVITETRPPETRKGCPWCKRRVNPGRTYCSPTCALKTAARKRRKVDPEELAYLHKQRWLPRSALMKAFGVTKHGIDNVVSRYGMSRDLPTVCKIAGCDEPAFRFRHCKGWMAGNLCLSHKREADKRYQQRYRAKTWTPQTPEQRLKQTQKASLARWAKYSAEERKAYARMLHEAKRAKHEAEHETNPVTRRHTRA